MANPYVLRYSNPFKTETIVVPSANTGSGINNYDTSLSLVGPGYPNYGLAYAQNFLNLLENFSSPYAPENAIEGQLWYDTSIPGRKVLRVSNGSDTSSRWPAASGIFTQNNDPYIQYQETVAEGDLWVDTANSQLKLRYGTEWKIVGPTISSGSDKTGPEATTLTDTNNIEQPVILNWSNGKVVEIISYTSFTPKRVIEGFSSISTGTNLTTRVNARYNGIVTKADSLVLTSNSSLRATDFLRNNIASQIHTGTFIVNSTDGLKVKNATYNHTIQINSTIDGARIYFSDDTKQFRIGLENWSWLTFDPVNQSVGIMTNTNASGAALEVNGGASFNNTVTISFASSDSLIIGNGGGINVSGNASVGGSLSITGLSTFTGRIVVGSTIGTGLIVDPGKDDVYDIGSSTRRFRKIYASSFGTTGTSNFYGNLYGTATKLGTSRAFSIVGQVATTGTVSFDGSTNVIFTATLQRSAIATQPFTNTATSTYSLLVLDTSTINTNLESISKANFLRDVYAALVPTGSIMPWSTSTTSTVYNNFLLCNGLIYSATGAYASLYSVIGRSFTSATVAAGFFQVPNVTSALTTGTIYYIIKT